MFRTILKEGALHPLYRLSSGRTFILAETNLHVDDVSAELSTPLPAAALQSRAFLTTSNKTTSQ